MRVIFDSQGNLVWPAAPTKVHKLDVALSANIKTRPPPVRTGSVALSKLSSDSLSSTLWDDSESPHSDQSQVSYKRHIESGRHDRNYDLFARLSEQPFRAILSDLHCRNIVLLPAMSLARSVTVKLVAGVVIMGGVPLPTGLSLP